MSDIVDELRAAAQTRREELADLLLTRAADEIERLRSELHEWRHGLK